MNLDWLWGAIATAILGGLWVIFQLFVLNPIMKKREGAPKRLQALRDLKLLLSDSLDAFVNQNFKARELFRSIRDNHPNIALHDSEDKFYGYDQTFRDAYPVLTARERDIFLLIRGTTERSLFNANSRMRKWLEDNSEFVDGSLQNPKLDPLRKKLGQLRAHLDAWLDKYTVWIRDEKRALVYLDDEQAHGPEFPQGMDEAVDQALSVLSRDS